MNHTNGQHKHVHEKARKGYAKCSKKKKKNDEKNLKRKYGCPKNTLYAAQLNTKQTFKPSSTKSPKEATGHPMMHVKM